MSDYYGDATLEDWLAEEVFSHVRPPAIGTGYAPIPPEVVALFERWREGVECNIERWMESDCDGEGGRYSWRGWGRGFNAIPDADEEAFAAACARGAEMLR